MEHYQTLVRGASSQVKWKGNLSDPFELFQGVHQGRVTSTELYKCYVDPLLHRLEEKRYGTRIGPYYVGAPTCADDILLASNSMTELQDMLDEAVLYSQKERYILHPQKSVIIPVKSKLPFSFWSDFAPWCMNDEVVEVAESSKHLGVERNNHSSNKAVIQDRTLTGDAPLMLSWELDCMALMGLTPSYLGN
ncbi:uncharacterized protein [Amphiura filiformis]|uniref:uncharacterized protein n=1 Tax=Amphiura filiformis TaxID=82378 RepID=UPI003B20C961